MRIPLDKRVPESNVISFVFMYIFKMEVFGAALATAISQLIGGIIPLIYFISKNNSPLKLVKTNFEINAIVKTCTNGSSEMLTNLSMSLVNMLYNMQLMKLIGADGVVAYGIIMYISFVFSSTYIGYSIGVAPIIGYHYGADNIGTVALVMTLLAEILAGVLASIFVSYNKELLEMTSLAIRLFSISFIISGFNIFGSAFFTALNNGLISAIISFLRTLVFQVIMVFVLPLILGINGIWLAVVAAEFLALIVTLISIILNRNKYQYI